jgi:hypothetical protein
MKHDRNEILNKFLKSKSLKEDFNFSDEDLLNINYSTESDNLTVEALKKMILCFCREEAQATIQRNTSLLITQLLGKQNDNK